MSKNVDPQMNQLKTNEMFKWVEEFTVECNKMTDFFNDKLTDLIWQKDNLTERFNQLKRETDNEAKSNWIRVYKRVGDEKDRI